MGRRKEALEVDSRHVPNIVVRGGLILYSRVRYLFVLDLPASQERLRGGKIAEEKKGGAWIAVLIGTNLTVVYGL